MSQIPLIDVKSQYAPLIPEIERRFREVLESGQFIRGSNYWAFQEEAAAYLGVAKSVGVANGTDAIVLALDAMEIGPGDEVICPAFTFYATAESIARRGATPVFADVDPADAQPRSRGRRREDHAAHARDHAGAPVRAARADGGARHARPAGHRGRGAGIRRARRREARHRRHVQLLPDEEPLLPRRRRARRDERRGARRSRADALVPRLARQDRVRLRRLQLAPRRGAGRDAASLHHASGRVERRPPRRRRPLRRARPRRPRRHPAGRAGPHLPPLRVPLPRARPHPRRADGGGDRVRGLLHDAPAPAARAALPRERARLAARDRARGRGELLGSALAGDPGRDAGAGGRRRPLSGRRSRPA